MIGWQLASPQPHRPLGNPALPAKAAPGREEDPIIKAGRQLPLSTYLTQFLMHGSFPPIVFLKTPLNFGVALIWRVQFSAQSATKVLLGGVALQKGQHIWDDLFSST
jgi:hypothetical protein